VPLSVIPVPLSVIPVPLSVTPVSPSVTWVSPSVTPGLTRGPEAVAGYAASPPPLPAWTPDRAVGVTMRGAAGGSHFFFAARACRMLFHMPDEHSMAFPPATRLSTWQ